MADGPWRVSLISVRTEAKAAKLSQQFADKGYRVETEQVEVEGTAWQRVVFPGQNSRDEAQELLAKLEQEFGISGGWIPPPKN
jgi:cell division septation protein DedD